MTRNPSRYGFQISSNRRTASLRAGHFTARVVRVLKRATALWLPVVLISIMFQLNAEAQPNLVFILTDDQGVEAIQPPDGTDYYSNELGCFTPRLATMASQGRVFTNFRVNPKCSPTRAGILTGRSALRTGQVGVVNRETGPIPIRDRASTQAIERTVAEVLQNRGYYTILIGKWHVGWARQPSPLGASSFTANQRPLVQGFDEYVPYTDFFCRKSPDCDVVPPVCDCPFRVDDDHITWSVDNAIAAVTNRPDPDQPYALFFWPVDPHIRNSPTTWWPVSDSLLSDPSRYDIKNEVDRYRAVVEAIDTECQRLLETLNIVDSQSEYKPASKTVVIFASDNGTPEKVSFFGPLRSKSSLYEGGIHVPLFVFGEQVPADGQAVSRLVSHTDLFATLMDITGGPEPVSESLPRESMSFANSIGWSNKLLPEREYTISSRAQHDLAFQEVALTDGIYKLVMSAGTADFAQLIAGTNPAGDRFYRLPNEDENLVSIDDPIYLRMREAVVDYWASAVADPTSNQFDIGLTKLVTKSSQPWGHPANLIPLGFDQTEDGRNNDNRAFMKFDIDALSAELAARGKQLDDIRNAEIIVRFAHDSVLENHESNSNLNYFKYDSDTGAIRAFPMTRNWNKDSTWQSLADAHDSSKLLGLVDFPPHILNQSEDDSLSTVPITYKSPISFGHQPDLRQLIIDWATKSTDNHGIVLMGTLIPEFGRSFQRIQLRREDSTDVRLRITLN